MATVQNGYTNGSLTEQGILTHYRFSDIPSAIDIPASTFDSEVEISLEELPDDPTELCTLLDNEKAAKNFWVIIALAYAKQNQIDHAIDILNRGLSSLAQGVTKEKLGLLGWICWLYMRKSREAPRVAPEGQLVSEAKTKDYYLQAATSTLNEASRLNPAYPSLFLARGVLSILRASLQPPAKALRPGTVDTSERVETLRQALKCFDESAKSFGNRNVMAILGRARAQYMLGRYAEALEGYQEVLIKMPNMRDPDPRIGIGCCLWQLDFKEQAKAAWTRALALNPESKVANILLGAYYLYDSSRHATNDPAFGSLYKIAMTQYTQKAFKVDKEYPMTCSMFGGYFLLRKHFPTVEALARKAIELTDVNAIASDGWYLLARKEHFEGNSARANEYYSRSDQARGGGDSGYLPAKFGAVQMQVRTGDYDGAKFRLEKIIQQTKNPESMTLLGALFAEEVFAAQSSPLKEDKSAEVKKATSLLESVRASWKDEKKKLSPDESVLLYLARLYESGSPEKSMQCLQHVEQMQLAQIPIPSARGYRDERHTTLGHPGTFCASAADIWAVSTALNACVKSRDRDDSADTDALVTTISYNLARTYEGRVHARGSQKSDYTEANARLTYIALRQSPTDEGPKKMAKLYELESTNLESVLCLAANIAEDHEQRHYKHTLQGYDKHDRYSLTGMGNIYLLAARDMKRDTEQDREKRRKMYEKAVEFFDKALQLDPKNAYAAQGIAIALVDDRKDYTTAVQIFSRIRDTLRDASVYLNLGHVYAELRQFSKSIENYEAALSKDRQRDTQILACLGRVWLLKGMQEMNLAAMNTALDCTQRARAIAPEQIHLEFNVAFVQNQIAQLVVSLPETQKSLQDVQIASDGLDEAINTFSQIAKAKHPPYPRGSLEQRANMGKNTIRRKLERTLQSQGEYEEKNATKLQQAREARETELRRREEEKRKVEEAELERKRQIAEDRQRLIEEAQRLAAIRAEEERAREEAEYTTDSETGDKVKRKKKAAASKRKKTDAGDDSGAAGRKSKDRSTGPESELESDAEDHPAPRKRRRLERRSTTKSSKYKSSEIVVESESEEDEEGAGAGTRGANGASRDAGSPVSDRDEDDDMRDTAAGRVSVDEDKDADAVVRRRRTKLNLRIEDDEDEEGESEGESAGKKARPASPDEEPNDEDDLFEEKSGDEAMDRASSGDKDTEMKDRADEDEDEE
ncbi:tetratricopeptide repeat protein [Histoplasma capsulatum var. duboisii H88]|uniref:Tetratricopeptide repeat protein n=1 Tax=Ajellomyces capsulatus (strain H88) TaxID=544711 RepID=F0UGA6_AJEC8|nr:tetratricopeptide repeat protein [Histoplasma capsulatum var. duboisii H88]